MRLPPRALGVYLIAGWPTAEVYRAAVAKLSEAADFFEMGVPTANPKYDGPFIRKAHREVEAPLWLAPPVPTYLMAYWEDYYREPEALFQKAAEVGARAVLAPDLLIDFPQELERYIHLSGQYGLSTAFFLPGKFPHRLAKRLAEADFIYLGLYAATGVELPVYVERNIKLLREAAPSAYVVAGFAVDTPEKAAKLIRAGADAVVVGTAYMKRLRQGIEQATSFLKALKAALRQVPD